ncbi:hypothetical protein HCR_07960 [Hydrogenimonas cancrithermarum]|uniref:Inner membrane protein n=2 Tax=Hydrogenimonas cancrithermarum TaxID=2993563 RepID=A0ABM8FM47_9BACT|nr:hypothetical protein HCR_07960 [Hydrogenimonas cancrithermarum]
MLMKKYQLSFTAVGLMPYEMQMVAQTYLECGKDWNAAEKEIIERNILQKMTKATLKRKLQEFKKRCTALNDEELMRLAENKEIKAFAFLSAIKTYALLYEFCIEVLRNKYLNFDPVLLESDWNNFIESKKNISPDLAQKSESTIHKAKQVIFNMLKGVGLIEGTTNRQIVRPYLSKDFVSCVCRDNPKWLAAFLYSESDIAIMCKERQ